MKQFGLLNLYLSCLMHYALFLLIVLHVNFFHMGCSKQSNKTYNFRKNYSCDVITLERRAVCRAKLGTG